MTDAIQKAKDIAFAKYETNFQLAFAIAEAIEAAMKEANMTPNEKIEANADLMLWCVHILGPDDIIAAPSHHAATIQARELNRALHCRPGAPGDVLCFAYAAPWPWPSTREEHTEAVKMWLKDETAVSGDPQPSQEASE